MKQINVGDWIRFYRSGILHIGQVEYIGKTISGYVVYHTDNGGEVHKDSILEVRSKNAKP